MIRENQQLLNQFNVLTDAVAVFLAMLVSYWLRFSLFRGIKGMPFNYYVWLGVVAAALTLVVFAVAGLYESFRAVRFHVEAGRVVVLELLVALIVMAAMFVLRLGETSRWSVAFFYGVSVLLLVGKRAALRLLLHHYRAMGFNQKRVLLVGHGESAEAYVKRVANDRNLGYQMLGYVADNSKWAMLPYCGTYDQLEEIFQREKPDEVVVALPTEEGRWMKKIINACEKDGTKLSVIPSYVKYMPANPQVDSINGLPLFNLRRIPLDNVGNAFIKRTADILDMAIDDDGALEIARRSRGTPRIANRLLKRVRDFAQVAEAATITASLANDALNRLEVDSCGLDRTDRRVLQVIIDKFGGGPVGLDTIAAAISESVDAVEDVYEPFLMQQGFLNRTPRGRVVTDAAYRHLGLPVPSEG